MLHGVNGCSLKPKLKLLNVQKGIHTNTIHANSLVYGTDLLLSRTGHQISQTKSSFELICLLVMMVAPVPCVIWKLYILGTI